MTQFNQRSQQVETQYNADHITIQQSPLSLTEKQWKQNRTRMLDRVQAIWIEGVLEPSLQGGAQLALELENKPSAIVTPLWQVLREFDTTGRLSSDRASIVQVYDHAYGEVLILGEPGAGKTTLLLELTHALLQRARQDEAHPIPVVFPLSSWATRRQPLTEWLASELHTRYQIPPPLAMSWIETDQVLPLLDGLDEVAAPYRAACVEAINAYRRAHGLLPTVICCRQADYLALSARLLLRTAVVVQPLTLQQVESYLASGGKRLEALRQRLQEDADLRALARTPLMLNVLTIAYQATPCQEVAATGSRETKREQIFAIYVQRMLARGRAPSRYTADQATHWLASLARQMQWQSQTVFYLEQLQPDWLSGDRMLWLYEWLAIRLPGLLIGVLVSLVVYILFFGVPDPVPTIDSVLVGGLLGGLLSAGSVTYRPAAGAGKASHALWSRLLPLLGAAVFIGLVIGLRHGLPHGPDSQQLYDPIYALRRGPRQGPDDGLNVGLSYGLSFGLCYILLQILLVKSNPGQSPAQTLPTAWRTMWQWLTRSAVGYNGLLVGLLVGLSYGLTRGLSYGLTAGLSRGLTHGLAYGLMGGLLSRLLIGRSGAVQLTDRLSWSWRNLLSKRFVSVTLQATALIGLLVGLNNVLSRGLIPGSIFGLSYGLILGLSFALLLVLLEGVSSQTIEDQLRVVPNQGIRRSAFNALILGIMSAAIFGLSGAMSYVLTFGLSTALFSKLSSHLSAALSFGRDLGLSFGLSIGLLVGLLNGGLACLRHWVLRLLLWRAGLIPWHYVPFLDHAAQHILLRKVGGGYIFLHRLLLDYFANLETGPGSDMSAESRQERLPSETMPSAPVEPTRADEHSDVSTVSLAPTPVVSEVARLLPCGHEWRPNAHFCGVCGAPVPP